MASSEWEPHFGAMEIWAMNTEYKLFGDDGTPRVDPQRVHWGRLDEMSKVLAVAPSDAAVRLFWADGVVSIDGADLARWTGYTGRRAPSEQQLSRFLFPNIQAAAKGDCRTRGFHEAKEDWDSKKYVGDDPQDDPPGTTPGVFVWRNSLHEPDPEVEGDAEHWPVQPTGTNASHFLRQFTKNADLPVGIMLDYDGAELRFMSSRPLSDGPQPQGVVFILGGPKGMSDAIKDEVRSVFQSQSVPLHKVCLGPYEEMAHACVAFLRLQEDAARLKAAITDLHHHGHAGYEELARHMEASWTAKSAKRSWRAFALPCAKRKRVSM